MPDKKYNYIKPEYTHQDMLTAQDIENKLKGYKKVEDINTVPYNTHIRYFIKDSNNNNKFRLGGKYELKDPHNRYIKLSNGDLSWSVQLNNSILYSKMSEEEAENKIKNDVNNKVQNKINDLNNKISSHNDLRIKYDELQNKYNNLKNKYVTYKK